MKRQFWRKRMHLQAFLFDAFYFIFEKSFNFFGKIVFEVDKMCYNLVQF